jgi:hypothetical protein
MPPALPLARGGGRVWLGGIVRRIAVCCSGGFTEDDPPVLDYGTPQRRGPSLLARLAARFVNLFIAGGLLFVAGALPHPQGIWYFGRYPKLVIAMDGRGLAVGRENPGPVDLGWFPLIGVKLLVYALPAWFIYRLILRFRRRKSAADFPHHEAECLHTPSVDSPSLTKNC